MSFFKNITRPVRQISRFSPRDFVRGAKDIAQGEVSYGRQALPEIFDPRKAGRNLRVVQWLFGGGRSPLQPKSTSEQVQSDYAAGRITTPDQQRSAIDKLVGFEPGDVAQAQAIKKLRDEGGLSRVIDLAFPAPAGEMSTPFSSTGDARFAVGDLREFRDPYTIFDQKLGNYLADNPGVAGAYLRETDPASLLPVLIEQDRAKVGAKKDSGLLDIGGRIMGTLKATFVNPFFAANRLEQLIGFTAENSVPDAHLRWQMASHTYELAANQLTGGHAIQSAMDETRRLNALDLPPEEKTKQLDQYFRTTGDLGMAGMLADLTGKIIMDPLWLIPFDKLGEAAAMPIKAATGAPKLSRFLRFATPAGRQVAGEAGGLRAAIRTVVTMPELAYAERKWALPAKGLTSLLFAKTPGSIATSAQISIGTAATSAMRQFATVEDLGKFVEDLNLTAKTGVYKGLVGERMPGLLEDPAAADFFAMTKGLGQDIVDEEVLAAVRAGEGLFDVPLAERVTLLRHHLDNRIAALGSREIQQRWKNAGAAGKIITDKIIPYNRATQAIFATASLDTPGFAWLNLVSNTFHVMWNFMGDPITGSRSMAHALWSEATGKATEWQIGRLAAVGLTPNDVETFVSRQSGARELFDIGQGSAEDIVLKMGQDTVENAREAQAILERASQLPTRHIGQKRRLRDVMTPWVYLTNRIDTLARRAAFYGSLKQQAHIATAGSKAFANRSIAEIEKGLVDLGVDPEIARHVEGMVRDEMYGRMIGRRPTVGGGPLNDADITDILSKVKIQLGDQGTLGGFRSGIGYAEDFAAATKGVVSGEAQVVHTHDVRDIAEYLSNDILPRLGKDLTPNQAIRMLRQKAESYFDAADIGRELGRMESTVRPTNTYSSNLRLTDNALRKEMVDTVDTMERFLRTQFFGDEGWLKIGKSSLSPARRFHSAARQATVRNVEGLVGITHVSDHFAEQGISTIAADTPIPKAWLGDLPDWLRTISGKRSTKMVWGDIWNNYWPARDESWTNFFKEAKSIAEGNAPAQKAITALEDDLKKTFAYHREIISKVPARAQELKSLDAAWREAASKIQRRFARNTRARPALLGLTPNDPARAAQMLDPQGPLAQEVSDFVEWVGPQIQKDFAGLKAGKFKVAKSPQQVLDAAATEMKNRIAEVRQVMVGNARAATDFAMLNYNNQYGIDQFMKILFPFSFWPTRQAAHWGVRAARNPGAFGAVVLAITQPREYFKQYGYPDRLNVKIPLYIPWLSEFLDKVPVIGSKLGSADFAPYYFIDPIRMLFPYKQMVTDNFDDPARRNTPAGFLLDYAENYTGMSVNPFMKIIGGQVGLLDADAWRSYGFQGGPFGIPITPTAREVGKWFYQGDPSAIPTPEQEFYAQRGYFSTGLMGKILGLEPTKFDVYRAERSLWTLALTDKLLPGQPHDKQVEEAWMALDSHTGPAWKNAVKAAESETFLSRLTGYIGFPAGPVTGVNQGEFIWLGLKAAQGEAAKRNELDKFYEKYPEFAIRSAVVKGISDPKEQAAAVDTELYYQSIDKLVDRPYAPAVDTLTNELEQLKHVQQSQPVREQIDLIDTQLRAIEDEKQTIRDQIDAAYPNRDKTRSINRDPEERALAGLRDQWYTIKWNKDGGETYQAYQARQATFISGLPQGADPTTQEEIWHELAKESILLKIGYSMSIDAAVKKDDFDAVNKLSQERDTKLELLHQDADQAITQRDFLRYMASFAEPKTPEQQAFEHANGLFDLWMSLVSSGAPFTSREKSSISAYFRSLPEMQTYYPLETISLSAFSFEQKQALMTRREFWKTYHAISDSKTKLDYFYMARNDLEKANHLLGLPSPSPIEATFLPPEYTSDPLFGHVELMSALQQGEAMKDPNTGLTQEEQDRLSQLLTSYGGQDASFGSLSPDEASAYLDLVAPQ